MYMFSAKILICLVLAGSTAAELVGEAPICDGSSQNCE